MKLKLSTIVQAKEPLMRLAAERFPAGIAYRIQRNIRLLEPEATSYEAERVKLVREKYGKRADGETYQVPPDKVEAFAEELNLLLAEEVELDIRTIGMDEFGHEISPLDLLALEWMFDIPGDPAPAKPTRARHPKKGA